MRLVKVVSLISCVLILGCSLYSGYKTIQFPERSPIKIAILDSGCNIPYKEGISFVDQDIIDRTGHGTKIAKIIKKVNPRAELYIAKVIYASEKGTYSFVRLEAVVNGIRWAVSQNVDFINMSFQIRDNKIVHRAIQKAYQKGIVLIAAAGNKNLIDRFLDEYYDRNRDIPVQCPARYDEVIAIGATSILNRPAKYSSIGREIEFVCQGSYEGSQGTSFASASAVGIISKIRKDWPELGVKQFRKQLRFYTQDLGEKGRDQQFGYGKLRYIAKEKIIRDY